MLISIDPGKSGAWAVFSEEGQELVSTGKLKCVAGQRFFTYVDLHNFEDALSDYLSDPTTLVIEAVLDQRMSNQSPIATNTTAANWGMLYYVATMWCDKVDIVRAVDWKRRLGLHGKDKSASVDMAVGLYGTEHLLKPRMRVPNADIAEAVLIGVDYGRENLGWEK